MSTTRKRPRNTANQSKRPLLPLALMLAGLLVLIGGIAVALVTGNSEKSGTPGLKIEQMKASPNAAIDGLKVDYGNMKLGGDSASLTVYLTNTGTGTIRFTEDPYVELKEGCWPPSAVVSSTTIQPGQTATVSVEFLMHGEMGGPHDFRLHLPTNDPANPDTVVTILSNWVE